MFVFVFFACFGDHRALHVRTHSVPTLRSSDLRKGRARQPFVRGRLHLLGCRLGEPLELDLVIGGIVRIERALGERHRLAAETADRFERSEEHTSELQSLMRISYAVFCLKKKTTLLNQD